MIQLASITDESYEPYTGGKPSPSPDYPQEIKSVGDSGSVAVKVMGKNLLPTNCGQNITALRYDAQYNRWAFGALKPIGIVNLRIIDPMTAHYLLSPGTYTITLVSFENVHSVTISVVNADWKTLATVVPGRLSKTFSVDANTIVGCYFVPEDANATGCLQVQLELGTTATSYEPYTEQFVQLPYTLNAIPVASGGNVTIDGQQYIADYVDLERGKVVRKIGKLILTGKENWMLGFENWTTYPHAFRAEELKKDILKGNTMNAKYTWYQKQANLDLNSMSAPCDRCIAVSDARFSSVNEFTNELKKQDSNGTPLTVYYVADTPQEENLSLEEIEQYKKLSIRTPTTIVENNYNTWMKATYKSIESV